MSVIGIFQQSVMIWLAASKKSRGKVWVVLNRSLLLTFLVSALSLAAQNPNDSTKDNPLPNSPCFARSPNEQIVTQEEVKGKLIHKVGPKYPKTARRKGIQGTVVICATIGKDGTIKDVRAMSGPEELVPAALDAVKQWRYQPFELKGATVEVDTDIRVNFQLAQ